MVDAYQDITIPFQMSSAEFFREVREHLTSDGVMVVNMNMKSQEEGNINEYLSDTIASVFPQVYTVDVEGGTNRELFAFSEVSAIEHLSGMRATTDREWDAAMAKVSSNLLEYKGGKKLLTDDKAPVELLGMHMIDGMIQEEIGYYKELFQEEGIKGILEAY